MSIENKEENGKKEEFSFIQEKIKPRKKNKVKKLTTSIAVTIVLAVIFGFVGRAAFSISGPFFDKLLGDGEEQQPILFPTEAPTGTPVPTPQATASPTPTGTPVQAEEGKPFTIADYEMLCGTVREVADQVNQSIVTIANVEKKTDAFNSTYERKNMTSGVVVAKNDVRIYILTTYSRINKEGKNLKVSFAGGETFDGVLQAKDSDVDLAVVTVNVKEMSRVLLDKVKTAELGESYLVAPGEPVIALGNPNGYMYSMDYGIITNSKKPVYITDNRIDLFHTSIMDNENGDGIIVDLNGKIKGIITHLFKEDLNSDINTVLSISRVRPILERMINKEEWIYFGIIGNDITTEISQSLDMPTGIYVSEVETQSPAFEAGIQNGDIIIQIDGTGISSMVGLNALLGEHKVRDVLQVTVVREVKNEKKELTFSVELEKK